MIPVILITESIKKSSKGFFGHGFVHPNGDVPARRGRKQVLLLSACANEWGWDLGLFSQKKGWIFAAWGVFSLCRAKSDGAGAGFHLVPRSMSLCTNSQGGGQHSFIYTWIYRAGITPSKQHTPAQQDILILMQKCPVCIPVPPQLRLAHRICGWTHRPAPAATGTFLIQGVY